MTLFSYTDNNIMQNSHPNLVTTELFSSILLPTYINKINCYFLTFTNKNRRF